ncbi:MAG: hypothetical protein VKL42_01700 [Snowella sp.]|nr:hypothetical protein [Snowella sp.]
MTKTKLWEIRITDDGKIYSDCESKEESCWSFNWGDGERGGFGATAKTREACLKKIFANFKEEIAEKRHEIAQLKKSYKKLQFEFSKVKQNDKN